MDLKSFINDVPDFPIPGITFRDITPLLTNPEALDYVAQQFRDLLSGDEIEIVAGIEARGFIIAMLLASKFQKGFLPIRKAGKLPPPVMKHDYVLEYGTSAIEMRAGEGRILIVDDVLATGGTLEAAIKLSTACGYDVREVAVLINLTALNSMTFQDRPIRSIVQY